jgi:hypothetical protein
LSTALDRPVLFNEFTGGGGLNGDAQLRGTLLPAGFGTVQNVEPIWFDNTNNIGMIDGYGNCTAITALFEGGNDFGTRVADYANYATLLARIVDRTVAPGRWATCVAQGLVGLGAPPVKPITVDATFGTNRAGALMQRLLNVHAGVSVGNIDTTAFDALDAAVNYPVHHWMREQRTVRDLIEAVAGSCNAAPVVSFQGKYSVTRAFGGAVIATINRQAPTRATRVTKWRALDPDVPTWRMRARAARPGATLTIDQINYADTLIDRGVYSSSTVYRQGNLVWSDSGAQFLYVNVTSSAGQPLPVLPETSTAYWVQTVPPTPAAGLFYADGTPIEALKPAQAGADVTGTNTAAAIAGQGGLATQDSVDYTTEVTGTKPPIDATNGDNLLPNANLEADVSQWAFVNASRVAAAAGDPLAHYFKQVTSVSVAYAATPDFRPAPDGTTFYFSGMVNTTTGFTTNKTFQLFVTWYDKDHGFISQFPQNVVLTATGWVTFEYKVTKPSGAVFYLAQINAVESGTSLGMFGGLRLALTQRAATLGADINSVNLFDTGGATPTVSLPRNEVRTPIGTAAAIAGQGSLATLNSLGYGTSYLTGFGSLAPRNRISLGDGFIFRADGSTGLTDSLAVTSIGTAAAIAGQGNLATRDYADMDGQVVDGTTYKRILSTELSSGVIRLGIAGSGYRIGDQRNLPAIATANLRFFFTGSISWSATGVLGGTASGSISVSAGAFLIGGTSVSVGAMSASISGLWYHRVVYQLYIVNPTYAGGSYTLVATSDPLDLVSADDRMWVGVVTVDFPDNAAPAGGDGSGGGGGGPRQFDSPT